MKLFFDIDGTICHQPIGQERQYEHAVPKTERISRINVLHAQGHEIWFYTARGATTGLDWADITQEQLNRWGVKHHGLMMGKPYYDLLVDDRAMSDKEFFDGPGYLNIAGYAGVGPGGHRVTTMVESWNVCDISRSSVGCPLCHKPDCPGRAGPPNADGSYLISGCWTPRFW